jgi:hypothetical protein
VTKSEFMSRTLGDAYKPDSNRTRTFSYAFDHVPDVCDLGVMARLFKTTSIYGPGAGEKMTADHLRQEMIRLARRVERYGLPFKVVRYGRDAFALVPT